MLIINVGRRCLLLLTDPHGDSMLVSAAASLSVGLSMSGRIELKWGALIGVVNLAWLYASYYLGLRDNGLALIQASVLVGGIISIVGYILGMREVHKAVPEATFIESIRSGVVMCGLATVIVVLAQIGYLKVVDPGYTDYIVGEIGDYYEGAGLGADEMIQIEEGARKTYGFTSCLLHAGLGAFLTGIIATFIIVAFRLRLRR